MNNYHFGGEEGGVNFFSFFTCLKINLSLEGGWGMCSETEPALLVGAGDPGWTGGTRVHMAGHLGTSSFLCFRSSCQGGCPPRTFSNPQKGLLNFLPEFLEEMVKTLLILPRQGSRSYHQLQKLPVRVAFWQGIHLWVPQGLGSSLLPGSHLLLSQAPASGLLCCPLLPKRKTPKSKLGLQAGEALSSSTVLFLKHH